MSITSFIILVLVVYLVLLKLLGLLAYRRSGTDTEDYFLSKREVPMLALVATTMASLFSTGTIVSAPSEFFTKGSGYFWVFFFVLVPVMMMLVVDKFWKLGTVKRFVTPAQLLEDFYGSKRVMVVSAANRARASPSPSESAPGRIERTEPQGRHLNRVSACQRRPHLPQEPTKVRLFPRNL